MKRQHKINHGWVRPAEPIDETYQRQLDRTTEKAETLWRRAQKVVERAEQSKARAEKRAAQKPTPAALANRDRARQALLDRLDELHQIEALMRTPTYTQPAAVHRTGRQDRLEVGQYRKPKKTKSRRAA